MLFRWFARSFRPARKPARPHRSRPRVEQFEDRLALSPLIPVTNHRDLVYDPYRNVLYITTSNGTVQQFNVTTQSLMPALSLGGNLTSADVSNDGSTLVVADQQTAPNGMQVLHRINLNTLTTTNLYYPSGPGEGGWGLALGPGSKGLTDDIVPNNGFGPMRQFDLTTGQEVFRYDDPGSAGNGGVGSATQIVHGADRSVMLITEGTVPWGNLFAYNTQTDTFSRPAAIGTSLTNALTAVNRNGTLFAVQVNGTTTILNRNLNVVMQLPGIDGGVAFDPGQDILYGVNSSAGQIVAYNTNTWGYQFGMPVGEAVPRGTPLGNGTMAVSNDGRWLFLATPSGVREYNLPWGSGPAVQFSVSEPAVATAGTPFSYTITALDPAGHVATGYLGTVHFISSDPKAVLPPDYTFLPTDLGAHTFSVTLKTAGPYLQMVNAYDIHGPGTNAQPIQVVPGAAAGFQLTTGTSNPQAAGYAFGVTVTAYDTYGNIATNYTGKVHFTSSDPGAVLPPDYTFRTSDQGRHTFSVALNRAGNQTVTATDLTKPPSPNPAQGSVVVTVLNYIPGLHFTFGPSTTTPTAGAPFDLTVKAWDEYNQIATRYVGTVTFTTTDPGTGAKVPLDYTFTAADAGVHTFTGGATMVTAGSQTLTVRDRAYTVSAGGGSGSGAVGTSTSVTVSPATAATLRLGGFPASVTAGDTDNATVTAYDAYGNVATTYGGTLHFTSSDPQAVLPADTTLTNGTATLSASLRTAGTQSLTVTDTANPALTAAEGGIAVNPAAASTLAVGGFPSAVTAGTAGTLTVTALDAYGNVATGYGGTVQFSSSDGQATLPASTTLTAGTGTFSATLVTAGSQSITVTDTANAALTGTQSGIAVSPAAASVMVPSGPATATAGSPVTITVTFLDAYGNVATGYAGTVHFASSDAAAGLPDDYTFTAGDAGTHSFAVTFWTTGSQTLTLTDAANNLTGGLGVQVS